MQTCGQIHHCQNMYVVQPKSLRKRERWDQGLATWASSDIQI